jgi:hypothetical protein
MHIWAAYGRYKAPFLKRHCSALPCRDESLIASPRLLPGNSYKHLDDARVGKGHVTASAVTSPVSTVTQQLKHRWKERFPRVRSGVYWRDWDSFMSEFLVGGSHVRFVVGEDLIVWIEDFKCDVKTLCVLQCSNNWSVWLIVCVLRAVARRQLVKMKNPTACATVCCKWCKSVIALYCCM